MSLFGIGSATPVTPAMVARGATAATPRTTTLPLTSQSVYAGGQMAQPSGASLWKRMLAGGGIGAALGFGASFFTLPVIGQVGAPIAAAVGGGIGAIAGLASGLWSRRKARRAMAANPNIMPPIQLPRLAIKPGATLAMGQRGPDVKWTQRQLKRLGVYHGPAHGRMDSQTVAAIRRYELMKGAVPTGTTNPELRAVLSRDVRIASRYVS
jgi:hypothetical protein